MVTQQNPFTGVSPATFAPLDSTYRSWLSGVLGGYTNPFSQQYASMNAPLAQLAYYTAPAVGAAGGYAPATGAATNPYGQFLSEGLGTMGGYTPLSSADWMARAQGVQSALGAGDAATAAQTRLQSRFGGAGGQQSAEEVSRNQQALVNAAVTANTPLALRGETGAILDRLYDRWVTNPANTGNYLDYGMGNVWGQFNLPGLS